MRDTQVGTRRIYSLDPDGIAGLRDTLETVVEHRASRESPIQEESECHQNSDPIGNPTVSTIPLKSRTPSRSPPVFTEDMELVPPPSTTSVQAPLTPWSSSHGRAVVSTTWVRTGASASGHVFSRMSLHSEWYSAGTSALSGKSSPTRDERVKWRCASSLRESNRTRVELKHRDWIATAKVGRECATRLVHRRDGTSGCIGLRSTSGASPHTVDVGSVRPHGRRAPVLAQHPGSSCGRERARRTHRAGCRLPGPQPMAFSSYRLLE